MIRNDMQIEGIKKGTGECTLCRGWFLLSSMFYGDVCLSCAIKKEEKRTQIINAKTIKHGKNRSRLYNLQKKKHDAKGL